MGTAELHHLIGKYCAEWERKNKLKDVSVLAAAYRAGVPCYTSLARRLDHRHELRGGGTARQQTARESVH